MYHKKTYDSFNELNQWLLRSRGHLLYRGVKEDRKDDMISFQVSGSFTSIYPQHLVTDKSKHSYIIFVKIKTPLKPTPHNTEPSVFLGNIECQHTRQNSILELIERSQPQRHLTTYQNTELEVFLEDTGKSGGIIRPSLHSQLNISLCSLTHQINTFPQNPSD